ncbi:purine and uridine phosphorylase [Aspergillus steynii IBT 23096]|uniref:Purine and uridine phosphorylase n=1 Tax=Aspergillus steynii IBT 23096 TaxID=1392250 RepID=A0A2I2GK47_9EURO|nr:purine and uridine phosphorylase [Aspergillus steynii IBT 23096]PLB53253.1 purine and uridine phosphorylase [Aspergillus steynii IBT 23096]
MPSSKWGILGDDPSLPAWVLYLQLQFSQPADCTLKTANVELSFQKLHPIHKAKLGPVVTEYFAPRSVASHVRPRDSEDSKEFQNIVEFRSMSGGEERNDNNTDDQWSLRAYTWPIEGDESGLHRRVEWIVKEAKPPYQTIMHRDQVRVGLVVSHDREPFLITVRIEGQLQETYGGLLRFGRSVDNSTRCLSVQVSPPADSQTPLEEIAKRLNDEMTDLIFSHATSGSGSRKSTAPGARQPVREENMKRLKLEDRQIKPLMRPSVGANRSTDDYTVGWICALPLEMAAARVMLDNVHTNLPIPSTDHNNYILGDIGPHNIVIACLPNGVYGTTSAAIVASQMQTTFKSIRFSLMVGIGGGVPGGDPDIRLGDVVVSKPIGSLGGVVQYDYGKTTAEGRFIQMGALNKPPQALLTVVARMEAEYMVNGGRLDRYLADMVRNHPQMHDFTHQLPVIHYGLIASGNQVMKHGLTRDRLAKELGIICFEMEAAGLMDNFPCLVIRGICDYADSHKNNIWQKYAAATAAAYAKDFLVMTPARQVEITTKAGGFCLGQRA